MRGSAARPQQQFQNGESEESHAQFLKALQNAVSTFVNRMKSNHVRGRSITNDSAVLSLFQSVNGLHPQLLELLNQLDERRRTCPRPARPPSSSRCPHGCRGCAGPSVACQRRVRASRTGWRRRAVAGPLGRGCRCSGSRAGGPSGGKWPTKHWAVS